MNLTCRPDITFLCVFLLVDLRRHVNLGSDRGPHPHKRLVAGILERDEGGREAEVDKLDVVRGGALEDEVLRFDIAVTHVLRVYVLNSGERLLKYHSRVFL